SALTRPSSIVPFCCWIMVYTHTAHIAALLSSCVSFTLITWSRRWDGEVGVLCMFCWTFSLMSSLLILLIEMFMFLKCVRTIFWCNLHTTISIYAALFCLNASIVFPDYFLKGRENDEFYSHSVVAEIFSCVASLGHLGKVWIMLIESKCYMASGPGLLQVSQTYTASAIIFLLANSVSFEDHPAVIWSLAVYCTCFICTFISIIHCAFQNKHNEIWVKGFNLFAGVTYLSACWPVVQVSQGQIGCTGSCQDETDTLRLWPKTRLIVVVVLTALNFLLYLLSVCCFYML
ncbi:hypothetical protein HF521_019907, partial [Silurus meridionalis]